MSQAVEQRTRTNKSSDPTNGAASTPSSPGSAAELDLNDLARRVAREITSASRANPFPLESYREAAPHLRRPFTTDAVKFKVQSAYGSSDVLVVCYIDARLVIERLNLVVPHLWEPAFTGTPDGLIECAITLDGLTRSDVGEGKGKAGRSDALKRAAVHFGVGVSLYATPKIILPVDGSHVKEGKKPGQFRMLGKGEQQARTLYDNWLRSVGQPHFGEALDHGDVADSAGDLADQPEQETQSDLPAVEMPLTTPEADGLRVHARTAYEQLPPARKKQMPPAAFETNLRQASTSIEGLEKFVASLRG